MVQVAIMLVIGGAAGAASFRHVHDVAVAHGQAGWLAWADAVVLELTSIAAGLELRRRKRLHVSLAFPAIVLAIAVVLSLGAQVVEAEPSLIGWIAAAIPAAGFLVMVKIALASPHAEAPSEPSAASLATQTHDPEPVGVQVQLPSTPPIPVPVGPLVGPESTPASPQPAATASEEPDPVVQVLVPAARAAAEVLHRQGRRVTRKALAEILRSDGYGVSNERLGALLKEVASEMSDKMSPTGLPGVLPPSQGPTANSVVS